MACKACPEAVAVSPPGVLVQPSFFCTKTLLQLCSLAAAPDCSDARTQSSCTLLADTLACFNPSPAPQRIAVMWMQGREAAGSAAAQQQAGGQAAAHPFIHAICCSELEADSAAAAFGEPAGPGLPLWLDTASGEVLTEPPPVLRSVRGGLFTDEPGLGKTITAVSRACLAATATSPAPPQLATRSSTSKHSTPHQSNPAGPATAQLRFG